MMKNLKKTISIMLCVAMTLSLSIVALADEIETTQGKEETTVSDTVENNENSENTSEKELETDVNETEAPENEAETSESDNDDAESTVVDIPEVSDPVVETSVVNNGEINVKVNGTMVVFDDVKPQIVDRRTLVPFRKVGEALNAAVAWRSTDKTVHCFRNGISIMMTIDKSDMEVRQYEMGDKFVYTTEAIVSPIDPDQPSVKAVTIDDRTMIPIRAAAEALGAKVDWDGTTNTVEIDIPIYNLSLADRDAAGLVENWNYKPATELKTGSVAVKIYGNFMGAAPDLGDGVIVKLNEISATTAEGGVCTFTELKAGIYTAVAENIPEGYVIQNSEELTFEVKSGEETTVRIALVKAEETENEKTEIKNK